MARLLVDAKVAERHGPSIPSLDRRLWDLFVDTAHRHPQNEAVVSLWQSNTNRSDRQPDEQHEDRSKTISSVVRWTYEDLLLRAEALASALRMRGCKPGMPLVVILGNAAEWGLFFWTAAKMRMPFVPLDPRALADPKGVASVLNIVKPAVIVVSSAKAAQTLATANPTSTACVQIQTSESDNLVAGWASLSQISAAKEHDSLDSHPSTGSAGLEDVALIVFTSGTTSMPKGCLCTSSNLLSQVNDYDPQGDVVDRWLVHTPTSHVFAVNNALRAWSRGDAVVFASEYFDVQSTLHALISEKCTFMSAVPTLVKALLAQPSFPGRKALNLTYVTMGGTTITSEDVKACRNELGAKTAIQAFGMSEGVPIASWLRSDPMLVDGYHPGVGKVLPGANIRVCAPGSNRPLAVNEVGELHIGGSSVIKGYLGGIGTESFYDDSVGHWHKTGDQAIIDQDGVLHLLGRYKDLIIRAGENIAPLKIENSLGKIEGVTVSQPPLDYPACSCAEMLLQAQVVGIPDETAGEVPVAVVKMPTKAQISKIASDMGAMYSLDGVYTLEELGLQAFPLTRTGKVRKDELKKAISRKRAVPNIEFPPPKGPNQNQTMVATPPESPFAVAKEAASNEPVDLTADLSSIIGDLVGVTPLPDTDLRTMMDSVTMLRYADRVVRRLGRRVYLQDVLKSPTIAGQAALLQSRGKSSHTNTMSHVNGTVSILEVQGDSAVSGAEIGKAPKGNELLSRESSAAQVAVLEALRQLELDVTDVENVYPIKAGYHRFALAGRPQTYRHRTIFSARGVTAAKVRQAVEVGLASRPLLRTILAQGSDNSFWQVGIRAPSILSHIIEVVEIPDNAALEGLNQDDSAAAFSPSLGTQVKIVTVRDSGIVNLILTYSHAVFDILSIQPFHNDLDYLISMPDPDPAAIVPSTPFKLFADLHHDYADSVPAKIAVRATAHRLRGISKAQSALWPRQKAPGWFVGSDAAVTPQMRDKRARVREQLWAQSGNPWDEMTAREFRYPRAARVVNLPTLQRLQVEKNIDPQTVAVAALAAFNAQKTGASYALFNTVDHGRSWPFVPSWMESMLPPPMSVDGPMAEWVLNMVQVDLSGRVTRTQDDQRRPETVGQFLRRVQHEQELASKHAHAPWNKVLEALGPDEAAVAKNAACRQTFVWDVTLQMMRGRGDFTSLKPEARYDWPDW